MRVTIARVSVLGGRPGTISGNVRHLVFQMLTSQQLQMPWTFARDVLRKGTNKDERKQLSNPQNQVPSEIQALMWEWPPVHWLPPKMAPGGSDTSWLGWVSFQARIAQPMEVQGTWEKRGCIEGPRVLIYFYFREPSTMHFHPAFLLWHYCSSYLYHHPLKQGEVDVGLKRMKSRSLEHTVVQQRCPSQPAWCCQNYDWWEGLPLSSSPSWEVSMSVSFVLIPEGDTEGNGVTLGTNDGNAYFNVSMEVRIFWSICNII